MKRIRVRYLMAIDLTIYFAVLLAVIKLRRPYLISSGHWVGIILKFAPLLFFWMVANYVAGCYEWRRLRALSYAVRATLLSAVAQALIGVVYFYLSELHFGLRPKTLLLCFIGVSQLVCFVWHRAFYSLLSERYFFQRIGVVASASDFNFIAREVRSNPHLSFIVVDPVSEEYDLLVLSPEWLDSHWDENGHILRSAVSKGGPIWPLDVFVEHWFGKILPRNAESPSWVTQCILPVLDGGYPQIKRFLDPILAGILLLILSPLLAIIACFVWLLDGRPILYPQQRLGCKGNTFTIWKFRTMRVGADLAGPFSSYKRFDSRMTQSGKFLRSSRIDELPQLWNILRGEMAIIGPRPEWMREVEALEKQLPSYHVRHLIKPGVTGWAQVCYRATNNTIDSGEKLLFDLYYLKNVSLALDISIVLKTVKRLFQDDFSPDFNRTSWDAANIQEQRNPRHNFGALIGREWPKTNPDGMV